MFISSNRLIVDSFNNENQEQIKCHKNIEFMLPHESTCLFSVSRFYLLNTNTISGHFK